MTDKQPEETPRPESAANESAAGVRAWQEVGRELAKVPGLKYEVAPGRIRIEPLEDDGFPVELVAGENGYELYLATWREEFVDEDEALDWLFFGLCDECRMEVVSRGNFDCRWTLQALRDGQWHSCGTAAAFFFPFWKKKSVRYLQNRILQRPPEAQPAA